MAPEGPVLKAAQRFSGWLIVAAILFIVLGVFAIIEPAVAGLGVALLVGWLFIFGGVSHLISAFEGGGTRRVLFQILAGVVFLIGGSSRCQSSRRGDRRSCLVRRCCALCSSRRSRAARVGRVGLRTFGAMSARRMRSASRSPASRRLRSCVR